MSFTALQGISEPGVLIVRHRLGYVMGEAAEGLPAVLARGLSWTAAPCPARMLIRPLAEDLFR